MNNTTDNTLVTVFMAPKMLILNQMETKTCTYALYESLLFNITD